MKKIFILLLIFLKNTDCFSQKLFETKEYWNNGNIKEVEIKNEYERPVEVKSFFENGRLQSSKEYNDSGRAGTWKTYYDNGNIESIINYKNDLEYGTWKTFYNNGNIESITLYNNGLPIGIQSGFYNNGKLEYQGIHSSGQCEWKDFHENGNIKKMGLVIVKRRLDIVYIDSGEWKTFYESGKLKRIENINNYYLDGDCKEFYENGNLKSISKYKEGQLDGDCKYYTEKGTTLGLGHFVNGAGEWKSFYDNGFQNEAINLTESQNFFEWKLYTEKGNLIGRGSSNDKTTIIQNSFSPRAFMWGAMKFFYLDSLIDEDLRKNVLNTKEKIHYPQIYNFDYFSIPKDFTVIKILNYLVDQVKKQTDNFNNIRYNNTYEILIDNIDLNLSPGHNWSKFKIVFLDKYSFKVTCSWVRSRIPVEDNSFFYSVKNNYFKATLTDIVCTDWSIKNEKLCLTKKIVIDNGLIVSLKVLEQCLNCH